MSYIHIPKEWEIPELQATSEEAFHNRRRFLKRLGLASIGALGLLNTYGRSASAGIAEAFELQSDKDSTTSDFYPATLNADFSKLDRPITPQSVASKYNNFYEFTMNKDVWKYVSRFRTRPWEVEVKGLVENPGVFDIDDLVRTMPLEERLYRFRCVEAWSMVIPWVGIPLTDVIKRFGPTGGTRRLEATNTLQVIGELLGHRRDVVYYEYLYHSASLGTVTPHTTWVRSVTEPTGISIVTVVPPGPCSWWATWSPASDSA